MSALLPDLARAQPWVRVAQSWAMAYAGQLEEAEAALADLQDVPDALSIQGHAAAIRAYIEHCL